MISALLNIPTDVAQLARFSFHNNDAHVLAARAIKANQGLEIDQFILDPIAANDWHSWLYTHQAAHNAINAVIGVAGNDLTSVDIEKLDELTYWIQLHANEHVQWGNILGYG